MKKTIGTCSLCGGPVVVDELTYGGGPEQPYCAWCKGVPVASFGKVINMKPSPEAQRRLREIMDAKDNIFTGDKLRSE